MTRVVHVAAELGQGGTERSIELLATAPQGPADQLVVSLGQDGPTGQRLRAAGVETRTFGGDIAAAAAAIADGGGAVALLNRSGRPEAKWNELIRRLAAGSVLTGLRGQAFTNAQGNNVKIDSLLFDRTEEAQDAPGSRSG